VAIPQASLHLIDVSDWQRLNFTGGDSGVEPFLAAHNQLLAHAAAVKLIIKIAINSQKTVIHAVFLARNYK
jgi:beta-glucosidase